MSIKFTAKAMLPGALLLGALAALAALAAVSGVLAPGQASASSQGGTLIWAVQTTPRHLNPAVQSGIATAEPGTQLFASPLRYDENWQPQPYLADEWAISDDGLSVTLRLNRDARFHDGEPVTSADVAFSIATVKENHPFKTMFAPVERVDTPDEHTAIIRLRQPHPAILLAMSPALLPILPEHVYGDGQDAKSHPANTEVVGSGPFRLVEFKRDEHIILERNPDFFIDGRPHLDRIVMRIIKDGAARTIALENGEVHISAFEQNARDVKRLKENDSLVVTADGYGGIGPIEWLAFNTLSGPLADKKVRQAIAYALDRDFVVNAVYLGGAAEALTGIYPASPFYERDVPRYDLDLDKANALLDEAGHPRDNDGERFSLTLDYGWATAKVSSEYVKAQLRKVGIDVVLRAAPDFPSWANRVSNHDFDMTWDVVFNWGDPVIGVHRTYQSDNIKKGVIWSNTQSYANPRVDALMQQAGVEVDLEKRKALYSEFQKILAEDLPIYWMHTSPYHSVYSAEVGNAPIGIWATMTPLDRVYLK